MHVTANGTRLYSDVEGLGLVPDGVTDSVGIAGSVPMRSAVDPAEKQPAVLDP